MLPEACSSASNPCELLLFRVVMVGWHHATLSTVMGVELGSCLSRSTFQEWGNWELACGRRLSAFLFFEHRDIVSVAKSFLGKAAATLHNVAHQTGREHSEH
jgi:hypothetical protein